MKKIMLFASALAGLFFAASCQQENLEPVKQGNTVTYTLQVPGGVDTKSTGDGFTLTYEVYRQNDLTNLEAEPVYDGTKNFENGSADITLEFVKDQEFTVLFWAQQTAGAQAYDITDLREVSLNTLVANDLTAEVFAGNDHVNNCVSDNNGNVMLVRPVAQLNIATDADSFTLGTEGSTTATVVPAQSKVVVDGLYGTYNVANGNVATKLERTYTATDVPGTEFKSTYKLMATNYLGFIPEAGDNVKVTFTIYTENDGDIEHTVSNVPVKANYQTNILGNLITATEDYHVTLEEWADAGKDMEVLADGIVKNIDGDYEVTSANGLAYAINYEFEKGGNFYLTEAVYDMSGFAVTPPTVPAGKTLNIYGRTPVVTRSSAASAFAGVTIIGLPVKNDVPMLIEKVEGTASISGVTLPDENACLISVNDGTVTISECAVVVGDEESSDINNLIRENTENAIVVNADTVENLETLEKALQSGVEKITLTKPIAFKSEKVLDLNGKTVAGESSTTGKNYDMFDVQGCKLTVMNGTLTAEFKGANMGWSASTNIFNITAGGKVYLDNVTAKNLGGSDMAFVAHLNNWGEATLNVENSTLESTYIAVRVFNSGPDMNNVTIKNSTLKGKYCFWVHNYKAAGDAAGTDATLNLDILNDTNKFEYTSIAPILYGFNNPLYFDADGSRLVFTAEELEAAIKAGQNVALVCDITMTESIAISNANFLLDGNGYTISMAENATNTIALFDITGGKAAFKNLIFDGVKDGAVVRTVGVEFNAENVTAQNGQHTQQQGLFRLLGKSTIKNCTFKNNTCSMVITLNYDGASNDPQVVENCVFEGNTCNGTAALYYVKGASATINANRFVGNIVNCNSNGATIYMGFTENNVVTNNLFQNNTVNEAGDSSRVAGGVFFGYETVFTGNAFIGNKVTGANAKGNDVCVSTYYTSIDLSGNYWGGNAPVEDTNYFVQHKSDERVVIVNDYLTENPIK